MKIVKRNVIADVETAVANNSEVIFLKDQLLHFSDDNKVELANDAFITSEYGDKGNFYCFIDSHFYQIDKKGIQLACTEKAGSFYLISAKQIITLGGVFHKDNYTYYRDGKEMWSFPKERGILAFSKTTLATTPNFKVTQIDFRDIETFKIFKTLQPQDGFGFMLRFSYMIDNKVIFIQCEKKRGNYLQKVIATCCDIQTGVVLWETPYEGSHAFKLNKDDGNLHALFGRHESDGKMLYFNSLDPSTGKAFLEIVETGTKVSSIPWLAAIDKSIMFVSDAYALGGIIWAFDLASKKIITCIKLGLEEGVQLKAPIIRNDEMYVLDSTKTLHVFDIVH